MMSIFVIIFCHFLICLFGGYSVENQTKTKKNIHEKCNSGFARSQNQAHTWKTFSYQVLIYVRTYHAAKNIETRKNKLTAKHLMYCRSRLTQKL